MTFNTEPYSSRGFLYKLIPSLFVALLMGTALCTFAFMFGSEQTGERFTSGLSSLLASSFYLTFCLFFALAWICLQIACLSNDSLVNTVFVCISLAFYLLAVYSIPGVFTLKLCMAEAILLTAGLRIQPPVNGIVSTVLYFALLRSLLSTAWLGESLLRLPSAALSSGEKYSFAVILFISATSAISIRFFAESSLHNRNIITHLDQSISRISLINQELQDVARKAGEEAAHVERHRISRDIHDISGYIFTNIISLMDAGMSAGRCSQEKVEEIFQTTRTQAREGLQETRRALQTLRGGGYSGPRGLEAIYRIKQVFQNITGVEVSIDAGNIPAHFGDDIDRMIYRTVQEALTNAMRHGRATKVRISLWLETDTLLLTVTDNGIGAKQIVKGIGLAGMEERLAPYGGTLETSNPVEGGFRISIRLPIPKVLAGENGNGSTS